jgi:hypothetical protein
MPAVQQGAGRADICADVAQPIVDRFSKKDREQAALVREIRKYRVEADALFHRHRPLMPTPEDAASPIPKTSPSISTGISFVVPLPLHS